MASFPDRRSRSQQCRRARRPRAAERSRPLLTFAKLPLRLGIALLALSGAACLHGRPPAPSGAPQTLPDGAAIRESLGGCADPASDAEGGRCPHDSFEPVPTISARAQRRVIGSQLARWGNQLDRAASELREALLYDPESPYLHTELAGLLLGLGNAPEAEEQLQAALQANPRFAPALLLAGRFAASRGDVAEARSRLRSAQQAAPDEVEPLRELLRLELSQHETGPALDLARQLEELAQRASDALAESERARPAADPGGALLVRARRLREEAASAWVEVAREAAARTSPTPTASGGLAGRPLDEIAAQALDRALALSPASVEVLATRAAFFETRRRFAEARAAELRLFALRPDSPEVLSALCRISLEAGDLDAAREHLRKLLELAGDMEPGAAPEPEGDPSGRGELRRDLAQSLLRAALPFSGARRSGLALLALDAALRLTPGDLELELYRATALRARGRTRDAAASFQQVATRLRAAPAPEGVNGGALEREAQVQAALALSVAGEKREGLRRLRALFDEHPTSPETPLGILEGLERAGQTAEALALLRSALQAHPGQPPLLYALALALDKCGLRDEALQIMHKLLALQPEHSGALNYVGYTLAEQGTDAALAEAAPLLQRAIQLRPDDGSIVDSYGFLLLRLGRSQEALAELSRAELLTGGDPVVASHHGDALLSAGRTDEARQAFSRALEQLAPRSARHPAAAAAVDSVDVEPERLPEVGDLELRRALEKKLLELGRR